MIREKPNVRSHTEACYLDLTPESVLQVMKVRRGPDGGRAGRPAAAHSGSDRSRFTGRTVPVVTMLTYFDMVLGFLRSESAERLGIQLFAESFRSSRQI
jgi:hypothetical protein